MEKPGLKLIKFFWYCRFTVSSGSHGKQRFILGPLMMISFTSYLSEDMKPWYEALSSAAKESYYGQKVKEELYPAGKEGTVVPDFKVKDKSGKEVALSTLRQGKNMC